MCEFCEQIKKYIPPDDIELLEEMKRNGDCWTAYSSVYLIDDILYFDNSATEYPHERMQINYCPMCGRKLNN